MSGLSLWHLLSLDAPSVATLWTAFLARCAGLVLPPSSLLAMFVAVWMLYAADRLLDADPLHQQPTLTQDLELRHLFHHRFRRAFLLGIGVATAVLAFLVPRLLPEALHLDLALCALLAGYFVLIHASSGSRRLPKEIAVGLFFSAAVFIPTLARRPQLAPWLAFQAVLFATLCCLNCLFIYAWEHARPGSVEASHLLTRFAVRHLRALSVGLIVIALVCTALIPKPVPLAIAVSASALLLLHRRSHAVSALTLRAAADFVLLTPLLFLPWLHLRS